MITRESKLLMTQRNLIAPGQGADARVAKLHQLCDADYAKGLAQRTVPNLSYSYAAASLAMTGTVPERSDLDVAIHVAQKMLTAYGTVDSSDIFAYAQAHGALTESLRIMLRALGAEAGEQA